MSRPSRAKKDADTPTPDWSAVSRLRRAPSTPPLLLALDASSPTPLVQQVFDGIRELIVQGRLRPGQRIPSSRMLASEFGIARSTAVLAYEQLSAEGYLEGFRGNGTYVSADLSMIGRRPSQDAPRRNGITNRPTARNAARFAELARDLPHARRPPAPYRLGELALEAFPHRTWSMLYRRRLRAGARHFRRYADPTGLRALREAILAHLTVARGIRAAPEQLLLVRGARQALDLAARVLVDPGCTVWFEDPGYLAARTIFECAGASLAPVPVDDHGMVVQEGIRRAPDARLAYVTPSHQYPLGATLPLSRRHELLSWARESGGWIVEDDYDSEFRYAGAPVQSLQGLDTDDRVLYVGTFSKSLFPALRLGYMVVPPDLVDALNGARTLADDLSPTLEQAVLADFIAGGYYARHLRRMRVLYTQRQEALLVVARELLGAHLRLVPTRVGVHLLGWLPPGSDDAAIAGAALASDVDVAPLSRYCIAERLPPALVFGFAAVDERTARDACLRLRDVLRRLGVRWSR